MENMPQVCAMQYTIEARAKNSTPLSLTFQMTVHNLKFSVNHQFEIYLTLCKSSGSAFDTGNLFLKNVFKPDLANLLYFYVNRLDK